MIYHIIHALLSGCIWLTLLCVYQDNLIFAIIARCRYFTQVSLRHLDNNRGDEFNSSSPLSICIRFLILYGYILYIRMLGQVFNIIKEGILCQKKQVQQILVIQHCGPLLCHTQRMNRGMRIQKHGSECFL